MYNRELYIPRISVIEDIKELTPDTRLFKIKFSERDSSLSEEQDFLPGQFVQVSVLGIGEVPISIASSPTQKGYLELSVRKVGEVTGALHKLKVGDKIGIRGPYGNSFPVNKTAKRYVYVGGGCGIAPLRSLIRYTFDNRHKFPRLTILYGARTSGDIAFRDDLDLWKRSGEVEVYLSVDCGPADPECNIGVVTTLFKKFKEMKDSVAFVCGPSVMMHFTIKELLALGVREGDIILSLERYMKCGVGKCGHCYIKDRYVCTDGPVFLYSELVEKGVSI